METYSSFAEIYDLFMDDIPYDNWGAYLIQLLENYGIGEGLLLELGCGTGNITTILDEAGYDMIGVDNSEEMLTTAMDKKISAGSDILYLLQDMREFELYGTVKAVVSICDSMNYLTSEADFIHVLELVNNYLDPGGIFIFDLNTVYKYEQLMGEQTICENREEASFIWENYYDPETRINVYDLTFFIQAGNGCYQKSEEQHVQRAYCLEEVKAMIKQAGMEYITAYDAFATEPPKRDSERIYIIAKEKGK